MYGKRLKELRNEQKLSQTELAERLQTTQSTIGKYEREELQPNIDVIIQICLYFNITADYLLGLEDETGAKTYIRDSFNNNSGNINFKA